jgi:hypothetical protein
VIVPSSELENVPVTKPVLEEPSIVILPDILPDIVPLFNTVPDIFPIRFPNPDISPE